MANEVTVFTFIDQCRTKSRKHDFDPKLCQPYMLTLGLSNDNKALEVCNAINPYVFSMDPEMVYEYYMASIPKATTWVKWPSKNKESVKQKKAIDELCKKYNISPLEAKKYL